MPERVRFGAVLARLACANACIVACCALLACDVDSWSGALSGAEVQLGTTNAALDLSVCKDTHCGPFSVPRVAIELPPVRSCDPGGVRTITNVWRAQLSKVLHDCRGVSPDEDPQCEGGTTYYDSQCPGIGPCQMSGFVVSPSVDDTLWAATGFNGPTRARPNAISARSLGDTTLGGIVLYHYAADGTQLSAETVVAEQLDSGYVYYYADLQTDARGHLFMAVERSHGEDEEADSQTPGGKPWRSLLEFDAHGRRVGAPIVFARDTTPQTYWDGLQLLRSGDSLVLGQLKFGGGGLGLLDPLSRSLRWTQSRAGRLGMTAFGASDRGEITVLTRSPNLMPSGRIEHFDATGELSWEHVYDPAMTSSFNTPSLVVQPDGDALMFAADQPVPPPPPAPAPGDMPEPEGPVFTLLVHKFGRDGSAQWVTTFPSAPPPGLTSNAFGIGGGASILSPSGTLLALIASSMPTHAPSVTSLGAVSNDGQRCALYEWADDHEALPVFRADPHGRIYFATTTGFGLMSLTQDELDL